MSFDWKGTYDALHASFPTYKRQVVIGITGNFGEKGCELAEGYYRSVLAAGATPVVIPPHADKDALCMLLETLDGLVLSGGADVNPLYLGEEPIPALQGINPRRDESELLLVRLAYNRQMPILGICRGMQVLAAALDGALWQDIDMQYYVSPEAKGVARIKHSQQLERGFASHTVNIEPDSTLYNIMRARALYVNSFHHQAVREAGPHLRVSARSIDGLIEAVESREYKSVMGVQWHPECFLLEGDESMMPLFRWLEKEASIYKEMKYLHQQILTLDSHEDTPMLFEKGVRFDHREEHALVDLHKMYEGRLDVGIMVAYLPQGARDEASHTEAYHKANALLDQLDEMVKANEPWVKMASTPAELYPRKAMGRKSIMRGIENGYAIGNHLAHLKHFRDRGVVYMTLCHNGDNDICDSARGKGEHGGLSPFGIEVVKEMNRLGMLIDLSHAAESTFYQVLDCSKVPVVCSHSCCRGLCDHPRNLTDEQMRALAASGGVMQVTLYGGFLREDGQAALPDVVEHIIHAIEVMGPEHVGIGSDFDGDGGVPGVAHAGELANLTCALIREGLTMKDLRGIWGGNFLRVMQQAQDYRGSAC